MCQFSLSDASIQPRTSLSKFEGDVINLFIRLPDLDEIVDHPLRAHAALLVHAAPGVVPEDEQALLAGRLKVCRIPWCSAVTGSDKL